jgi:hypothetical protein
MTGAARRKSSASILSAGQIMIDSSDGAKPLLVGRTRDGRNAELIFRDKGGGYVRVDGQIVIDEKTDAPVAVDRLVCAFGEICGMKVPEPASASSSADV